jgi:hypothetical protein
MKNVKALLRASEMANPTRRQSTADQGKAGDRAAERATAKEKGRKGRPNERDKASARPARRARERPWPRIGAATIIKNYQSTRFYKTTAGRGFSRQKRTFPMGAPFTETREKQQSQKRAIPFFAPRAKSTRMRGGERPSETRFGQDQRERDLAILEISDKAKKTRKR